MKKIMAILLLSTLAIGVFYLNTTKTTATDSEQVTVYQSRTCGCCHKWVKHLTDAGFNVKTVLMDDVGPIKERLNVPRNLSSCHTAKVGNYIVEGHVPAQAIRNLLASKPELSGIAVAGMPIGSPGMEGSYKENYDVISFDKNGNRKVFMSF